MDPREAERFEEGLDFEYHDASENHRFQEHQNLRTCLASHGGCGGSSLRECVELLNNTKRNYEKTSDPQQVMSPNVEEKQTTANTTDSGSTPSNAPLLKNEPQSRSEQVNSEAATQNWNRQR